MKRLITICAAIVIFATNDARAGTWAALDYPGVIETYVEGISGNNIVGHYSERDIFGYAHEHGFIYNRINQTWEAINAPGASWTYVYGIDGSKIVGASDGEHGNFLYDGTTWTAVNKPGAFITQINDLDGDNLVGYYGDGMWDNHGFLYNNTDHTWTDIDVSGATGGGTAVLDISGNKLVGGYLTGRRGQGDGHGFIYDGTTWTTLIDMTGATSTVIHGISGDNLVGQYRDDSGVPHGFLHNGGIWTTIDKPGAGETYVTGIDGSNIVGWYTDATGTHGFVYEIPEPATILLLGLGSLMLRKKV